MGTPKCPSCSKLCSMDDPEIQSESCDLNGYEINASVDVSRNSACCGDEVKTFSYEIDDDLTLRHECEKPLDEGVEPEFELVHDPSFEVDCRTEGKGRGLKTFWIVRGTATVKCVHCESEVDVELVGEAAASEFDEVY